MPTVEEIEGRANNNDPASGFARVYCVWRAMRIINALQERGTKQECSDWLANMNGWERRLGFGRRDVGMEDMKQEARALCKNIFDALARFH